MGMPEIIARYVDHESNRGLERTGLASRVCRLKWLAHYFRDDAPHELTTATGDTLERHLRKHQKLSPQTVRCYVYELARALEWAYQRELVSYIPWIDLPKAQKNVRGRHIEEEELMRIVDYCDEPYSSFFHMLFHCPRRAKEIRFLSWDQVFLGNPKNRHILWKRTKNGRALAMPLHDGSPTLEIIKDRLRNRARGCPWVWWTTAPGGEYKPIIEKYKKYHWNPALEALGLDPEYRVHDLRVTWVTDARQKANLPREAIMACTGHQSETTFRYYSLIEEADVKPAYDALWAAREKEKEPDE